MTEYKLKSFGFCGKGKQGGNKDILTSDNLSKDRGRRIVRVLEKRHINIRIYRL